MHGSKPPLSPNLHRFLSIHPFGYFTMQLAAVDEHLPSRDHGRVVAHDATHPGREAAAGDRGPGVHSHLGLPHGDLGAGQVRQELQTGSVP